MAAGLRIAGMAVRRGTKRRLEIPIARLPTGVFLSLPVAVVHGRRPGPCVWLSAALHGDEINGVEIIRDALQPLDPETLRGTILAVPVVNVFGFVAESRYLPDRRDLNRSFPGSETGSLAARLAHLFMTEIVARSTHGIDCHTGSNHRTNYPHVRGNLDDRAVRRLAGAFGTALMVHGPGPDGSLRQAAAERGIPCLVYEAGEASRFDDEAVNVGVAGVHRVLAALKMVPNGEQAPADPPKRIDKTRWVRARQSGIARLHIQLGERVRRGQALGVVADTFGEARSQVRAPADGMVLGLTRHPLVHRGNALVHLAVTPVKKGKPVKKRPSRA
ncbi:MAG: succinylglutamate desuccinylase/aspartoacylase family protein [Gemmatimonadota bacterium]|nr:succinylglutamate desuccinylase/aspartoacylase family protein [Gemmatimonadota bacterium]